MYTVNFYTGDYYNRQQQANEDGCLCYVEQHFNSSADPAAGYCVVITGSNASQTSKNWGRWYAKTVAKEFGLRLGGDQGIVVGGYNGRGDYNLRHTNMPAILLEPLFASNPQHAERIKSDAGQHILASILKESIDRFFQKEGIVGFSVGHKYKDSRPNDLGAAVYGGGHEADYAEKVLEKAKVLIEGSSGLETERIIKVVKGDKILWSETFDEDDHISWDSVRGILTIRQC
jgi:hypothetical protein